MISFGGESAWESLRSIGIALAVIGVVIGLLVWIGRRRGSKTIALDAALTISGMWIVLNAIGGVVIVFKVFQVDWAELSGRTLVWMDWPASLPCLDPTLSTPPGAVLHCAGTELTDFTVENASLGLRALAGAAQFSSLVLTTLPAVILAVICFNTLRGRAFSRTITRALVGGAIAVLVFGVASELLSSIAATSVLRAVFTPDSEWYPSQFQLTVTPLPFIGALMLAALAAVFRQGLRLQQQRDALQRENAALADDTRGLV